MHWARYFDNAATTPVAPEVREAMLPYLGEEGGNAHSIHGWGQRARDAVERARAAIASLMGAEDPSEIVFTSGATEANNWVARGSTRMAISPFEHASMRAPALAAGAQVLPNSGFALCPPEAPCDLVSVMRVNNETGAVLGLQDGAGVLRHSDVTQALGKLRFPLPDLASASSHKLYGPKGVGVLYARGAMFPAPLIMGGEQELGHRSGTLNVPGIVGFGRAAELAAESMDDDYARAGACRSALLEAIRDLPDALVIEAPEQSPYIASVCLLGLTGETVLLELDREGFAVSAGPACSSGSSEPSLVLSALGLDERAVRGAIRISFGRHNTPEATQELGRALKSVAERLRKLG